jgi:hypothetical protein
MWLIPDIGDTPELRTDISDTPELGTDIADTPQQLSLPISAIM